MKRFNTKLGSGLALLGALVVAGACGPEATPTAVAPDLVAAADHIEMGFGHILVCKEGVGSGSFTVVAAGTVEGTITMPAFDLAAGDPCVVVADVDATPGASTVVNVSITETPAAGTVLAGVTVSEVFIGGSTGPDPIANGGTVTAGDDGRVTVTFTNEPEPPPPPPPGDEGCTPGFYKNLKKHSGAWDDAMMSPFQTVGFLFPAANNAPYTHLGAATLHAGLSFRGGNTVEEKAEILIRAGIAAWLNASNPNVAYPLDAGAVRLAVNDALMSGDATQILDLATQLDDMNNLGCPL